MVSDMAYGFRLAISQPFGIILTIFNCGIFASIRHLSLDAPYGCKTGYDQLIHWKEDVLDPTIAWVPTTCKPIHISGLFRHGTRYPSEKDITNGHLLAKEIRGKVPEPYSKLNGWLPRATTMNAKQLHFVGKRELENIGIRMAQRYRDLLSDADSSELYFQITDKKRTHDSAMSFQEGLEAVLDLSISPYFIVRNDILRFYDNCTEFIKTVENNKEALKDFYLFVKGPEVKAVAEKVAAKLGIESDQITSAYLKSIYTNLAFEEATMSPSHWLEVLDKDDLRVLEYATDLKNYWRKAYGYPINWQQACPLLKDVFLHIDTAKDLHKTGERYTKAVFRFGHAETLMPFVSMLGLFKDEVPPRADNFQEVKDKQLFKGGRVAPMAGNIVMVLYHCSENNHKGADLYKMPPSVSWPKKLDEYMVQLFLHELPIKLPFCDHHICPYSVVKEHYADLLNYDFEELCKLEKHNVLKDEL